MKPASAGQMVAIAALFVVVAIALSWPLPLHLATHLTGVPAGDTGIYVWNQWVFHHELSNGRFPLRTETILPFAGPADLSLHNYTVFSNLLALPLIGWIGPVAAFNVVYLVNAALAGFFLFLLARRVTGGTAESVIAGVAFACAPFLIARAEGHFSLAAAAPLPAFMLAMLRAWDRRRLRDALLAGVALAWAAFCDPYFAVFCLILAACFLASRLVSVSVRRRPAGEARAIRAGLTAALLAHVTLIVLVQGAGDGVMVLGPLRLSMRSLYTPMLMLTLLVLARVAVSVTWRIRREPVPSPRGLVLGVVAACAVAAILLSPTLYAAATRIMEHDAGSEPIYWRSSAPGTDLAAYLMPNPNHPASPQAVRDWLEAGPGGFSERVASLSWVVLAVIALAWWLTRSMPHRLWLGIAAVFGLMSIGPFLHVAGVNTFVPGPWALLRYVPLIGAARMPGRMSIVVVMALCVLFAAALTALASRSRDRRAWVLGTVAALLAIELLPAPRTLYRATPPAAYDVIASDPRAIRVLELPTGVKDGKSAVGNFAAEAQFQQIWHGKRLIGGYLSRVPADVKEFYRTRPVLDVLVDASVGNRPSGDPLDRAVRDADEFLRSSEIGYVVMRPDRTPSVARDLAIQLFGLTRIAAQDGYEVYTPKEAGR